MLRRSVLRPRVGERERAKYEAMGKKYGVTVEESAEEVTLKNDPMETEEAPVRPGL